jgi:hypothetical protein
VLLAHGFEAQGLWTKRRTVGKRERTPAATQQVGLAGFDLADFGEDEVGLLRV